MPTQIGELFKTNMPDLTQIADIQEALRIYHYGVPSGLNEPGVSYNPNNTNPVNLEEFSVAGHLQTLTDRINNFSSGLTESAFTEKGVLITASAPTEIERLDVGSSGQVLTVNPFTLTGLEWKSLDITTDNFATLANKTLDLASVTTSGIKFLGSTGNAFSTTVAAVDPTANRTIFLPNLSTTLVGNNSTDIFTNKTVSLETNTITGTVAQFNTALTDGDFLTTLNAVTVTQGGTGATTPSAARSNLDIFRNTSSTSYGGKIYVANPATVGDNGSGIVGAVAGDLWFW
jgi:hypothetical protein